MKRILALTIILTGAIGLTIAFAGPERMESKEVMQQAPAPCDWGGFYLGINGGIANTQFKFTDIDYFEGFGTTELEDIDFTAGGQVGYNWQNDAFVWGLEADAAWLNTERTRRTAFGDVTPPSDEWEDNGNLDFMGTVRARAGLAVRNALIYVTAGGAYASGDMNSAFLDFPEGRINDVAWNSDDWWWGWTAGVGAEFMINCHWTARLEALYTNFDDDTVHGTPGPRNTTPDPDDIASRQQFDLENWTVRVGLNYKFGGGR